MDSDKMFSPNSVVSVPENYLFKDILEKIKIISYKFWEHVYGVVIECRPDSNYVIHWAISSLSGITKDEKQLYKTTLYKEYVLTLIVTNMNDNFDKSKYESDSYFKKSFLGIIQVIENGYFMIGWH